MDVSQKWSHLMSVDRSLISTQFPEGCEGAQVPRQREQHKAEEEPGPSAPVGQLISGLLTQLCPVQPPVFPTTQWREVEVGANERSILSCLLGQVVLA